VRRGPCRSRTTETAPPRRCQERLRSPWICLGTCRARFGSG
jgi:hypothetical protein